MTLPYRLIALDLDGTLLRTDHTISPRSRRALARAMAAGIHVTLASGRSYASMRPWVEELGITAPVISYQGATVTDPRSGERAFQRLLPTDLLDDVIAFAREHDLSLTLYAGDVIYLEDKRHSDAFYERWFGLPWRIVPDLATALPEPPVKFILIGEGAALDAVQPALAERMGARMEVLRSHEFFLEGLALGTTKGSALAWVAERLGVPQSATVACGDAGNDRAMVAWAGLGVAMANGSDDVKEVADVIAPHVDEDGVAQIIERYCLNGYAGG
jgi:Cof subfamily protein (haloacid dehalogenase superfamily)